MDCSTVLWAACLPVLLTKPTNPDVKPFTEQVESLLENHGRDIKQLCENFRAQPPSPERAFQFERELAERARELSRKLTQVTYNSLEPDVEALPKHIELDGTQYTRLNKQTPQDVWTLFGQIRLHRTGYRPTDKNGEPTLFPLALSLGLVEGASPALAAVAARLAAETGATQRHALDRLKLDHDVCWGVKKLRQVVAWMSQEMAEQRHQVQVDRLLKLLQEADVSRGCHKPVLAVGRDGITLRMQILAGTIHEVATCGTVTVFDRRGKRLGTVYLAFTPESGQGTMSEQLTRLVTEVLKQWEGKLPRLCYVTDSGDNETTYYDKVLSRMKHPRTGEELEWIRVADYYHVSERVWTMAELLFGRGDRGTAWARKMQKWLLKPDGGNRVLHSAAAHRDLQGLDGKKLEDFEVAYRYIRDRLEYMRYTEYRKLGVPLGSGITEAGCKTVYTQRMKLSGMRWKAAGAQTILNLRVLLLSGVWEPAIAGVLKGIKQPKLRGRRAKDGRGREKAA